MARHKKRKPSDTSSTSTLKALQTQLTDPRTREWVWSGAKGVRERIMKIDFMTLRNVVDKMPMMNAIINTRVDQILPFCSYTEEKGTRGFNFVLSDRRMKESEYNDNEVDELEELITQTGFDYDAEREDDFADFVSMIVRETLTIDQIATELQRDRKGDVRAYWLLDAATIKRVTDDSDFARGVRFVQQIEQKVYNEFTGDDILFDYKYKRADIRYRGYGYAAVEQAIDIITTLLFGYNYIRDQLVRDRVPKGFIAVMGDAGQKQLNTIRSYWWAAMTGAGAQWNIPILPSGKDGVGIDFKTLGDSNRDMEYHKLMMFATSILAAVCGMDLMELGIKTDDSTSLIGENASPRIQTSKDRGLQSMLSYIEQYMNKILRRVGDKYRLRFVGMEKDDDEKKAGIRSKEVTTWRSIDEIREEDGLEPYGESWSEMPLQPQAVQIYMAEKGIGGAGGFGSDDSGESDFGFGDDEDTDNSADGSKDTKELSKSMRAIGEWRRLNARQRRVVRHIIE